MECGASRHWKDKEWSLPWCPREGTQPCRHLDFSPLRPGSNSQEHKIIKRVVESHHACANLSQQSKESHTPGI